jgi:tight adherence protein B
MSMLYEMLVTYPASVRARLREAAGKPRAGQTTGVLNVKQLAESASAAPGQWQGWAHSIIEQSGVPIELQTLAFISLAAAAGAGAAIALATGAWWAAAPAALCGGAIPWGYVWIKRQSRLRQLTRQLPDALDVMCRAVRAGQTIPATFQMIGDDFAPPIAQEFRHCYEQQNLGISFETALRDLARRTGIMELRILVVALLVQSRSGGSLSDLMQNLSSTVRKRLVLQQKVRALTGEGRMQAVTLIALPFLVFVAMYFLNREYAQILLDRPAILTGCVATQLVGAIVIQRMIQIDY